MALLRQTPFSRFSSSVDSPQFSPHVPRRGNLGESSVSCSRVLSSRESRSSERGSRVDKRARSREVSSRGRRCRSRSLSSYRSRFGGCERGRRSSSASRSSRGRSCCERSRSSDRYRSQRGGSRSRRAWSRSSDRCRSRRDLSRCARSRSFARCRSHRERARFPACRGVRRVRSRSHALPIRSLGRSRSCVRLPASPARLRAVEAGRLARRGPQEGVGAFVSQPPVAWCSGGRPSCSGGASIAALPSVFFQELAKFVMSLSGSSSLGASGVLAGVTASAAASWGIACPASAAAGAATLCAATVTPAGAGVFCLLLPLLFLACLVISSVRGSPALAGVAVGRLVMGPTDVLRALQGKVSFFCPLFASSGGGAVALPQIRLWMTDLSLLLPVPGMRLEVRILVALPGILTARLVLGRRGLLQGLSLCQSGARLRPPRPSGVADVAGSFTFAGFRLA